MVPTYNAQIVFVYKPQSSSSHRIVVIRKSTTITTDRRVCISCSVPEVDDPSLKTRLAFPCLRTGCTKPWTSAPARLVARWVWSCSAVAGAALRRIVRISAKRGIGRCIRAFVRWLWRIGARQLNWRRRAGWWGGMRRRRVRGRRGNGVRFHTLRSSREKGRRWLGRQKAEVNCGDWGKDDDFGFVLAVFYIDSLIGYLYAQ